jgi:MoxR-like ATPase
MERSDVGLAGDVERQAGVAHDLLARLGGVVLGQETVLRDALAALIARGHVLLEGVPGTAKTLLVRSLSLALGLEFRRIQFTPDLMPSDVTGVSILGAAGSFSFRPGPLFADLVLADEINRAPAKTQAALLEAMQERSVTVDGVSHPLSAAFTVFATQNPIEFEGTYPLPEAELDRFLVKVMIGYPESETEQAMLQRVLDGFEADDPSTYGIAPPLGGAALESLRATRRRIRVEPSVVAYIAAIVRATRRSPSLTLGASPRGSVALLKLAQATALLAAREYLIPDDVKGTALAALRHRVTVAPELELEGVTADAALRAILEQVDAPK